MPKDLPIERTASGVETLLMSRVRTLLRKYDGDPSQYLNFLTNFLAVEVQRLSEDGMAAKNLDRCSDILLGHAQLIVVPKGQKPL